MQAFITSQLSYCNTCSLMYGLPNVQIFNLQHDQNAAVRLNNYEHTQVLTDYASSLGIYWLPLVISID